MIALLLIMAVTLLCSLTWNVYQHGSIQDLKQRTGLLRQRIWMDSWEREHPGPVIGVLTPIENEDGSTTFMMEGMITEEGYTGTD